MPYDSNMIIHNPIYNNHLDFVKDCFYAVTPKYNLIVREHPKFIGCYEKKLYDFIKENKNIDFDYSIDPFVTASNCKGVIVMNSMFGIQCLLTAKNIYAVAKSYYDQVVISNYNNDLNIRNLLSEKATHSEKDHYIYLYNLIRFYLIPGHYRQDDPDLISKCCLKILKNSFKYMCGFWEKYSKRKVGLF